MKLDHFAWRPDCAGDAVEALARAARFTVSAGVQRSGRAEDMAQELGLEAEPLSGTYSEIDVWLREAPPALFRIHATGPLDERLVAVLDTSGNRIRIVAPDHVVHAIPLALLRAALHAGAERAHGKRVDSLLERIPLSEERRARARAAVFRKHISSLPLDAGWSLRMSPGAPFLAQLRRAGVLRLLRAITLTQIVSFSVSLLAWWIVGRGALAGHLDSVWLYAWALCLATWIPIRVLTMWWQGAASVYTGFLLKHRMLFGALALLPDAIRREGSGQLLGRVLEVGAVEEFALHGGFVSLVAVVELAITIPVLAFGPSGFASVVFFLCWLAYAGYLIHRFARRWRAWSNTRVKMTHDMIEGMLGHRTRVAQESPGHWHDAEDRALAAYTTETRALDRLGAAILGVLPRGWLMLGFAALAPTLATDAASPEKIAVGIGGVFLARSALLRLTTGVTSLVGAMAAWKHAAPLFHAAALPARPPDVSPGVAVERPAGTTLLDVRHLDFRYRPEGAAVLRDVTFRIRHGDRVLIEGPSGSGKSTFGSVLAGLRQPESGLVLLRGLDRTSVGGETWRRRIAAAPQFHENHILSETLAFNLLMGRRWPPRPEDLHEAGAVCRELGLGPLLDRMPGGLLQRVGETGWQLSHGERSRVYLARALLQGGELVILDESFASLDPETQKQALECAMRRAPTLIVIAHP